MSSSSRTPSARVIEAAPELPPRLRCDGARLLKPNGKPVILRGINQGSVYEDTPEDAAQIAETNANVARIALRWWNGDAETDARDNNGFAFLQRERFNAWIDKITAASAAGLWVVPFIDSDCGQCGMQDPKQAAFCDPHGTWGARGRNFFTDASMRRLYADVVWPAAAARLRTIAKIAFLELQPEPSPVGMSKEAAAEAVRAFYRQVIASVREVDRDTPFLLGPREGYKIDFCDEAWLEERTDCVYTGNLLNHWVIDREKFDRGLANLVAMRDARDVPVFVQQLGRKTADDRGLAHMRHALEHLGAEDVGFTWWQWRQKAEGPDSYGLNFRGADGTWQRKDDEIALLEEAFA